jgi:Resolvase, N terminal domain
MTRPDPSRASERTHERAWEQPSPTRPLPGPSARIRARHVERLAVVYVRQSTLHHVACHRESTALQYDRARYAIAWGWPRDRVLVIDEDLGQSAQSAVARPGFQRLLAEVALGHVNDCGEGPTVCPLPVAASSIWGPERMQRSVRRGFLLGVGRTRSGSRA